MPFTVGIIGGGVGGLALANGMLKHGMNVWVAEKEPYCAIRQGYQIQLNQHGIDALKTCMRPETYEELARASGSSQNEAPILVDPSTLEVIADLSEYSSYPRARPMARIVLLNFLLHDLPEHKIVHHGKTFSFYEVIKDKQGNEHIRAHFDGGSTFECDVLVAADGCHSIINELVGLKNITLLTERVHVQFKSPVEEHVMETLPDILRDRGVFFFSAHGVRLQSSVYRPKHYASLIKHGYTPEFADILEHSAHVWQNWCLPKHVLPPPKNHEHYSQEHIKKTVIEYLRGLGPAKIHPSIVGIVEAGLVSTAKYARGVTSSNRPHSHWRQEARQRNPGYPEIGADRVFLLGDALHPMPATQGQGANTALEDAAELLDIFLHLKEHAYARKKSKQHTSLICNQEVAKANHIYEHKAIPRAFKRVHHAEKAHECDDSSTINGRVKLNVWLGVLELEGAVRHTLELLHIKDHAHLKM